MDTLLLLLLCTLAALLALELVAIESREHEPENTAWKNLHKVTSLG